MHGPDRAAFLAAGRAAREWRRAGAGDPFGRNHDHARPPGARADGRRAILRDARGGRGISGRPALRAYWHEFVGVAEQATAPNRDAAGSAVVVASATVSAGGAPVAGVAVHCRQRCRDRVAGDGCCRAGASRCEFAEVPHWDDQAVFTRCRRRAPRRPDVSVERGPTRRSSATGAFRRPRCYEAQHVRSLATTGPVHPGREVGVAARRGGAARSGRDSTPRAGWDGPGARRRGIDRPRRLRRLPADRRDRDP